MSFRFYIDPMPDWFMDKVTTNEVILHNCDYRRYDKSEAYCLINGVRYNGGALISYATLYASS